MNLKTRNMLVAFCVVAVLAVALVIVVNVLPDKEEANRSEQDKNSAPVNQVTIVKGGVENVSSLTVTNQKGSYTIRKTQNGDYEVEGLEGFTVNSNVVHYVLSSGAEPQQEEALGEMENLADFGLEPPVASIEVHFADGTEAVYHLGDQVPGRTESRYMRVKDSKEISIVHSDERLLESSATFVQPVIVDEGEAQVTEFTLSGSSFPQSITVRVGEDGAYRMVSPVETAASQAQAEYCVVALGTLSGFGVEALHPSQEQLEQLGLTKPAAVIQYVIGGKRITLSAAPKNDSVTYVMREGIDAVFEVDSQSVQMWTQTSRYLLQEKQVFQQDSSTIERLSIQAGDSALRLTITREKDEYRSTENTTYYTYTPTRDGAPVSAAAYQGLVAQLSALSLTDAQPGQVQGEAVIDVSYQCFDGGQGSLQLYRRADDGLDVVVNGVVVGQVKASEAEKITAAMELLNAQKAES